MMILFNRYIHDGYFFTDDLAEELSIQFLVYNEELLQLIAVTVQFKRTVRITFWDLR